MSSFMRYFEAAWGRGSPISQATSFLDGHYFCKNSENLRLFRNEKFGFTPCLLDVSVFGLVLIGVLSIIFMLYRRDSTSFTKKPAAEQFNRPHVAATFQSRLFFNWASPLLKTGYTARITEDNIWDLCDEDSAKHAYSAFYTEWNKTNSKTPKSIWIALFHAFGPSYLWAGFFKAVASLSRLAQPYLFRVLIAFITDYNSENGKSPAYGFVIAFRIFALLVLQAICLNQYEFITMQTGLRVQSALTMTIYEKTTRLSNTARSSNSGGTIVNYVAADVQRVKNLTSFGHMLWSTPLQICLALYSLYQLLGASAFIGFAALVGIIPLNNFVSKLLQGIQATQRHSRDERAKLLTEMLMHIKSIKLLGWIPVFLAKLEAIRNDRELSTLKKQGISLAFANMVWNVGPFMVSFLSLTAHIITQNTALRPEAAFPALALLQLLNQPLAGFPYAISAVLDASDSIKILSRFLQEDEIQPEAIDRMPLSAEDGESVTMKDVAFTWNDSTESNLSIPRLVVYRNKLCCVVGSVGSGKSTLLQALVGGVFKSKGNVKLHGSIAYVAQVPWIINGSIKDNILFGHELDPEFYDMVLEACALKDDLLTLTSGDETQVGGQGMNLSGGQKARVALARAIYARADIYLLDDVLSAVDMHVRKHLICSVLGPQGMLRDTTRILTTNIMSILEVSDLIVMLEEGRAVDWGHFENARTGQGPIANFLQGHVLSTEDELGEIVSRNTTKESWKQVSIASKGICSAKLASRQPRKRSSHSSTGQIPEKPNAQTLTSRSQEKNNWKLYKAYAHASGFYGIFLCGLALLTNRSLVAGTDVWVKVWTEANGKQGRSRDSWAYIGVYFALGIASAVCSGIQMYMLLAHCSFWASKNLNEKMSHAVFHSPMSFFETTAFGEIITRFSSDMYRVDDRMARFFNSMLSPRIRTAMTLSIIAWAIPNMLLAIVPLGAFYLYIQNYFIYTSRELNRLESKSSSLTYTHIQSVYTGISTIRAFGHQDYFKREMEEQIDTNQRAYFATSSVDYWLSIRLELLGAITTAVVACLAIFAADSRSGTSAAMIGLALVNAERITSILNIQVRSTVYLEGNLVSLKRVVEYGNLPIEGGEIASKEIPSAWPEQGAISFRNYSTRYREDLNEVLQDLNLTIKGGEKIGVVGRTGAGKSSLTLALFRIIEATQGEIEIDGISTLQIPLQTLRSRIAIIPQDASIFTGTIRSNLDQMSLYDDTEIWNVLRRVRLESHISSLPEKLSTQVHESGSNFSVGQRQLLSLARALLRNTSILVLDEATASVDPEMDRVLQEMLNGNLLKDRTIITIAHRIETILQSDQVLVLENGKAVEFGTPRELMEKTGLFYDLVMEAGVQGQMS